MRKITAAGIQLLLCFFYFCVVAQDDPVVFQSNDNGRTTQENDASNPCISPAQYAMIEKRCQENIKMLGLTGTGQNSRAITTLSWPLEPVSGFEDCGYYVVFQYVDEDTFPNVFKDYNCGATTYDGHRGTDIGIAPFPFYKMDHDDIQVVAAAPGTIIDKMDGHFDKNCAMNDSIANYVIIQHADGSVALYWHMKKTSITTKAIGQTVATGEYLGFVGSSGSATGPHLHIEVWSDSSANSLNDPYSGSCNIFNSTSWWADQKPYREPAVIHCAVDSARPILPACPATETPNECNTYLAGGGIRYYLVFLRDQTAGLTASMSIFNINGGVFTSWTYKTDSSALASYLLFEQHIPVATGTYVFQTTYNGTTCSDTFEIVEHLAGITTLNTNSSLKIYPNPSTGKFTVEWENGNPAEIESGNGIEETIGIYNLMGEQVFQSKIPNSTSVAANRRWEFQLNVESGAYFCQLRRGSEIIATTRLMMQ